MQVRVVRFRRGRRFAARALRPARRTPEARPAAISSAGLLALAGPLALAAAASVLSGCVQQPRFRGPLPARNQHPAQLTVLHMDPADTQVLAAGETRWRTDLAYTSLWLRGTSPRAVWDMDGEVLRAAVDARVGLGAGWMLSLQLPFAHSSGGFLDDFVIDYHEWFGFPDQGRDVSPRDQFSISAVSGSREVWSKQAHGAEMLDVPLGLTWQLREPGLDRFGVALRAGLELPTGDQDRGYGNGEVDFSLGAVADYQTSCVGLHAFAQHTFAGTPRISRRQGFAFRDVTSIGGGVELPLTPSLSALVQAEWETSTLRDLEVRAASRDQMLLWVGGRYDIDSDWSVEVGLGEDLIGLASPDFTVWLAVEWRPGRSAAGSGSAGLPQLPTGR